MYKRQIYVVDSDECFAGAIDLKDLITAREGMNLESIIAHSYPVSYTHLDVYKRQMLTSEGRYLLFLQ